MDFKDQIFWFDGPTVDFADAYEIEHDNYSYSYQCHADKRSRNAFDLPTGFFVHHPFRSFLPRHQACSTQFLSFFVL